MKWQNLAFIAVALSVFAGVHYYLWTRLVRAPAVPPPWRRIATVALILLAAGPIIAGLVKRLVGPTAASLLAWPAYVWLGLGFFVFLLLLGADIGLLAAAIARRLGSDGPLDPGRRTAVARSIAGAVGGVSALIGAFAVRTALAPVAVRDVRVSLRRLPREHDGLTIVQLTDMHVGPTIGRAFVEDIVRRTNALQPDIIAITGDLVDGPVRELQHACAPLGDLRARHGVYFVTGNHEYYVGADSETEAWMTELGRLGIRVLRNERVAIGEGAAAFDLAGVDDWSARRTAGHGPDLPKALAGRDPSRELVLLAHQPKAIHEAARLGVGLQLSGHTHAGQIWPFTYLVKLQQPFVAGLARQGDTQIYVSPGTGYWGPPMRIATAPEITRITLGVG